MSTKLKHIPTKLQKHGQYLYSTNTARATLFPQDYALSCQKISISNSTNSMLPDIVLKNQLNIVVYQHNLPKMIMY